MYANNIPVWYSNIKVLKLIRSWIRPERLTRQYRELRHQVYRKALDEHQQNQAIYELTRKGIK